MHSKNCVTMYAEVLTKAASEVKAIEAFTLR